MICTPEPFGALPCPPRGVRLNPENTNGKGRTMTIKTLQRHCDSRGIMMIIEREGPHCILVFDILSQTPRRYRTVRRAAEVLGASDDDPGRPA